MTETKTLSVVKTDKYLALGGMTPEMAEAMAELAADGERFSASDMPRATLPQSKGTKFLVSTISGDQELTDITGVFVGWQQHGVLWPNDDPVPGTQPVLRTYDFIKADQTGPIPDHMIDALTPHLISKADPATGKPAVYNWKNMPYSQYGTAKKGNGKLAKEQRLIYILREQDVYPIQVTAPPGSLKRVTAWRKQLATAGLVPWRCVVSLKLETANSTGTGVAYPAIIPTLVGVLGPDDAAIIKKRFSDPLKSMAASGQLDPDAGGEPA